MLARECTVKYGAKAMVADLDDFDHKYLDSFPESKLAIFILATYGEGDPTDNAIAFWETLRRWNQNGVAGNRSPLRTLQYCAFGLGNSSYQYFNKVIDDVDSWLLSMGSKRLGDVGKGDESRGSLSADEDFSDWKSAIIPLIGEKFGLAELEFKYEPDIELVETSTEPSDLYLGERSASHLVSTPTSSIGPRNPYGCPVSDSYELYTESDRNCLHLEFDLSATPEVKYQTGDHLAVWPVNPNDEVDRLMRLLALDEDSRKAPVALKFKGNAAAGGKISIPSPTTREAILKYYLEICGPVSPDLLPSLLQYAPTEKAKTVLQGLIRDRNVFKELLLSKYTTIAKIMELADSEAKWAVPFGLFIERLGRLQPRYYSIASSPAVEPRKPAITAVVVSKSLSTHSSSQDEKLHGVTSNYLLALKHKLHNEAPALHGLTYELEGPRGKLADGKIYMHIRHSTFKLPANSNTPIIMVAAGTGIAPFRGFVQERARVASTGRPVGQMLLFFGCRSPKLDYLYRKEWETVEDRLGAHRFRIVTAFSRLGPVKVYVQNRLEENGELVSKMLDQNANFYVCGSADMARDVRRSLTKIIMAARGWSEREADRYMREDMKQAKRLQEDVWAT